MTQTVDDLRNEIRLAVGRYERVESTAFTKEALAAICASMGDDSYTTPLPPKARMRASILRQLDDTEGEVDDRAARPFRKADLEAIAAALRADA